MLKTGEPNERETKPDVGDANGVLRTGGDADDLVRRRFWIVVGHAVQVSLDP